ncbi:S8 family serine peptidase [Mucilaginibacter sp. S1162]|uniref:S8 family serine peptidase n=1 Tax=Mucilaginibacter humi TaxID=2732510 RepID=A0ABX1W107_9SPHI|nr:S8 family serine peptidase [Mucilaginibacter humi]NNU33912.1 S8 family serine peptidase [Mucilaginibacter humi]
MIYKKKFYNRYGILGIEYDKFNKSVLFEIVDERKFDTLVAHVDAFCSAEKNSSYEGAAFALVALIHDFDFISTNNRLAEIPERGAIISLINSSLRAFNGQKNELFNFLEKRQVEIIYNESYPALLELGEADIDTINELAQNFDIVRAVTSARAIKVRPGEYGDLRREFGFTVTEPPNLETVGLIDTGVNRLEPIKELISAINYDHTGFGAYWDESGHGTMVAGLIILGEEFIREVRENYEAKARVAVIKAIHNNNDEIKITNLLADIRHARREHGIRIFSMSLNIPSIKKYNENYSYFAYELDKLAYEEDLLIFLSVGNIDADRIAELTIFERHDSHRYPTIFYCPAKAALSTIARLPIFTSLPIP